MTGGIKPELPGNPVTEKTSWVGPPAQGWESDQEDASSKEERRGTTAEEGEMEEEG